MFKIIVFISFFPLFSYSQGSGSLTIVSDAQQSFSLYVNGKLQNESASSNVRVQGLTHPYYDVRIDFKDESIQDINKKNLYIADSDDKLMDAVYKIKTDKAGKTKLAFYSLMPVNKEFKVPAGMQLVLNNSDIITDSVQDIPLLIQTTPEVATSPDQKAILSNVKGATISLETTNKTADSLNVKSAKKESMPVKQNAATAGTIKPAEIEKKTAKVKAEDPGKKPAAKVTVKEKKCNDWPMMKADFQKLRAGVEEAKSEALRTTRAKELASNNCLLVTQVAELANLLSSESSMLSFMEHAYQFTIDRTNYHRLGKLFTTENYKKRFMEMLTNQ